MKKKRKKRQPKPLDVRAVVAVMASSVVLVMYFTFFFIPNFPCVINGVAFDSRPKRVVCVSRPLTEIIAEIGLTRTLVGRPFDCDSPKVEKIPAVGSSGQPSVDLVLEQNPDLVIIDNFTPKEAVDALMEKEVKLLYVVLPFDRMGFRDAYACVGAVMGGARTGQRRGLAAADKILIALDDVERATMANPIQNVCIMYEGDDFSIRYITGDAIGSLCIQQAGGRNVANEGLQGRFRIKRSKPGEPDVLSGDPDIILCPDDVRGQVRSNRDLLVTSAIRDSRIYSFDVSKLSSMDSNLILATWELARMLHPALITPEIMPAGAVDYFVPTLAVMNQEEMEQFVRDKEADEESGSDVPAIMVE